MQPLYKYLLIISLTAILGFGLLRFFANTQPNVEVVVINKSGQPISLIHLQTEKTGKNIRVRGIAVGGEVTVKFHNDGEDTFSLLIRFPDGKEIRGESVYIEPWHHVISTVTGNEITSKNDRSLHPGK